jgi:hypothetical protein
MQIEKVGAPRSDKKVVSGELPGFLKEVGVFPGKINDIKPKNIDRKFIEKFLTLSHAVQDKIISTIHYDALTALNVQLLMALHKWGPEKYSPKEVNQINKLLSHKIDSPKEKTIWSLPGIHDDKKPKETHYMMRESFIPLGTKGEEARVRIFC